MGVEMERMAERSKIDGVGRTQAYYFNCLRRATHLAEFYPNYKIQVGPDVAEFIKEFQLEITDPENAIPDSLIERFEIMEDGFKVACFEAEMDWAREKADETGCVLSLHPRLREWAEERGRRVLEKLGIGDNLGEYGSEEATRNWHKVNEFLSSPEGKDF